MATKVCSRCGGKGDIGLFSNVRCPRCKGTKVEQCDDAFDSEVGHCESFNELNQITKDRIISLILMYSCDGYEGLKIDEFNDMAISGEINYDKSNYQFMFALRCGMKKWERIDP